MKGDDLTLWLPGFAPETAVAALEVADAGERERALDPLRSLVVQAPAGSGKTELLIQRYLTLLARASVPEAVVAITFTIKAAGEMRERVMAALDSAQGDRPARPHEQRTWDIARSVLVRDRESDWNLLRSPARLRIQTVDALCMAVTRQMPWLARMGAMPNVTEDAMPFYRLAAESTIRLLGERGPESGAVECLLRHLGYNVTGACDLLAGMLEIRDHWARVIGSYRDPLAVRGTLESSLDRIIKTGLGELRKSFPQESVTELAALVRYAASQLGPEHELAICRDLTDLPGDSPADLDRWKAIAGLLLKNDGHWRKTVDSKQGFAPRVPQKDRMYRLLALFGERADLFAALKRMRKLPAPAYSDSQWEVLEALFMLLPRALAELRVVFADHGTVDFVEIANAAQRALGTTEHPTDLALALGNRLEHLLVDEFQDTSRAQYDLLRSLTAGWDDGGGATLFLVGDPMQSIYRFRQADVGLYLAARENGIGDLHPESVKLSVNFRSAPAVVAWVNETFAPAFPAVEDPIRGGVPYSASTAFRTDDSEAGVYVHPMIGRRDDAEGDRVVSLIEQERNTGAAVAVLVRARTHLIETARTLRRRGIRFRAIEIDSLGERPAVLDTLALTRALLHLGDRPAWLAILRAPWCGLTLADLHALAGGDLKATVWDLIRRPDLALSPDGVARLERLRDRMEAALDRRGRMSMRALVEGLWMALGGPQCLPGDGDLADVMTYFDLLEGEESGGGLADIDAFSRKVHELFAAPDPAAPAELELMTIHKAKGLEFDCVIIPGLGRQPKHDDEKLLLWTERPGLCGPEVLLAPIGARHQGKDPTYRHLMEEESEKSKYEAVRLLYVACTRARRKLHLVGHVETKESDSRKELKFPERGSFLELLWPKVKDDFSAAFAATSPDIAAIEGAKIVPRLRRLPRGWRFGDTPMSVVDRGARAHTDTPSAIDNIEARQIGTVIHRFLEQIGAEGLSTWTPDRVRASRDLIEAGLVMSGALKSQAEFVEEAVIRTLEDARGRWILTSHPQARSEFAVAGVVDGAVRHFQVDRTFVDSEGIRWVIDFKTSGAEDIDAELARYASQLETYAKLLRQIDGNETRAGLYFPLAGVWREWPV